MKAQTLYQPISEALERVGNRIAEAIVVAAQSRNGSFVAAEHIAKPINSPQARDRRRRKDDEINMEVTDLDRAAADKAARNLGLVFVGRRR